MTMIIDDQRPVVDALLLNRIGKQWDQLLSHAFSKHAREVEKLQQQANRTRNAVARP
jgi:hypothetical protein